MYGEVLPNQNGAPVRLVVPWKYGFKSGKSIVKIRFVEQAARDQLGARGPRGVRLLLQRESQGRPSALEPGHRAAHRRRRSVCQEAADLMFNGYEAQVGQMYAGMDLKKLF